MSIPAEQIALIEAAFADNSLVKNVSCRRAVDNAIAALDAGAVRAAEFRDGAWVVNEWVKKAIVLYFVGHDSMPSEAGSLEFFDKVPMKRDWSRTGVRVVPPGCARYGSYLARNVILMPGFVNIGAYVGAGTMVDTWATVGSCAQIGAGVHLSGGVGVGGVLEPPSARPVIIEDGAFIGSRCVVVEGILIEHEAVLGAGVVLTASTPIIDVTGAEPAVSRGRIPARSVVIAGSQAKQFPAGAFHTSCALIVGQRSESTDRKTSLNAALREFDVAV